MAPEIAWVVSGGFVQYLPWSHRLSPLTQNRAAQGSSEMKTTINNCQEAGKEAPLITFP